METFLRSNPTNYSMEGAICAPSQTAAGYVAPPMPQRTNFDKMMNATFNTARIPDYLNFAGQTAPEAQRDARIVFPNVPPYNYNIPYVPY